MSDKVVDNLDKRTGLWVFLAIGFSKQVEKTVTDIVSRWVEFTIIGIDLTEWGLFGLLWMGTLAVILIAKTMDNDDN